MAGIRHYNYTTIVLVSGRILLVLPVEMFSYEESGKDEDTSTSDDRLIHMSDYYLRCPTANVSGPCSHDAMYHV